MLSTGDIKQKYEIIGLVGSTINNQETADVKGGCGGCGGPTTTEISISTEETYERASQKLLHLAKKKGGDAVIYATFDYRIAISGAGNLTKQVKELFCYGTAVKITN